MKGGPRLSVRGRRQAQKPYRRAGLQRRPLPDALLCHGPRPARRPGHLCPVCSGRVGHGIIHRAALRHSPGGCRAGSGWHPGRGSMPRPSACPAAWSSMPSMLRESRTRHHTPCGTAALAWRLPRWIWLAPWTVLKNVRRVSKKIVSLRNEARDVGPGIVLNTLSARPGGATAHPGV